MNNQITSFLKIQKTPCGKLRNCTFNLLSKPLENRIIKRNMRTMLNKLGTKITKTSPRSLQKTQNDSKNYATRSLNKPEHPAQTKDPQALINNPITSKGRHTEIHRQECQQSTDCATKDCATLCGLPGDRKATGHMTSSPNPPIAVNNTHELLSSTNLQGDPKTQYGVFYKTPHDTSITKEHISGTIKLNSDSTFKQKIIDNEK